MSNMTKEMMKSIDSYSQRITTIKNFVTAVRQMPGMYIGPISNQGFVNMFREIFQNSIDQIIDPNSPCNWIEVWYDMRKLEVSVEDNGLGLPFNDMGRILTEEHTSKNYTKQKGEYSSGLHGVGAKVVNALSEYFIAESYHYSGEARRIELVQGEQKGNIKNIPNKKNKQGTKIIFKPCVEYKGKEVMGLINVDFEVLYTLTVNILSLTPIGSKVSFNVIDLKGKHIQENIVNRDGIITNLIMKTTSPLIKPIVLSQDTGFMKADIAFVWESNPVTTENITAFANFCPTSISNENTHVSGFKDAIGMWISKYMNNIFLGPKSKVKVISKDVLNGLDAMLSVAHLHPIFTGQAKEIFSNKDMKDFIKSIINNGMEEWAKKEPQDLNRLCKFIKEIADARQKSDQEKVKIANKYVANKTTGLPFKFAKPTGPLKDGEEFELAICEGDSAAGSAKKARDPRRQGIFGIRGKMPNAFKKSLKEVLSNEEVQGIRAILSDGKEDLGIGKNFNVEKCKYKKIIFMADADVDGAHICSLLERLFLVLFPGLIIEGRVYKAVPPLFGIPNKKGDFTYFTERSNYTIYTQKEFMRSNTIQYIDKNTISGNKMSDILNHNEDYIYELKKVSDNYSIDPILLEMIIRGYCNKIPVSKLQKEASNKYRFAKLEKWTKGYVMTDSLINKQINTILFGKKMAEECKNIIPYFETESLYPTRFILNGNIIGLYELMQNFNIDREGLTLSRYKGLGEMNGDQLAESTLHPDGQRVLIRYTVQNLSEEIERIRYFESDKSRLFKYVGKVSREDLIG